MINYIKEDCENGLLPSSLFRIGKSYDCIMSDHLIIRQMKIALEQSILHGYITHYPFEDLIKEAYFQCGIIQLRLCCRTYYDYLHIFVNRSRPINGLNDRDKVMIVGGMVYLLLFTRKSKTIGTTAIIDEIWKNVKHQLEISFSTANPFQKLLESTESHEIDFGICPLPINTEEWKDIYWGRIENIIIGEADFYKDAFDDYHKILDGTFDENAYSLNYRNSLQLILDTIGFKTEQEQIKLLDIILTKDLFYLCEETKSSYMIPCPGCEYHYVCVEHSTFNRLRAKTIEDLKLDIIERFYIKEKELTIRESSKSKKKKTKIVDFKRNITKPEKAESILKRLHELIDRHEKPIDKIRPLMAAIMAGAIKDIPHADFVAEFGDYNPKTYSANKNKLKGENWRKNDEDFKLYVSEFKTLIV